MVTNKNKILFLVFLLIGIIFCLSVQAYSYSSGTQYIPPRTTSAGYLASQGISLSSSFDENICKNGQDFVLQVSPLGCDPVVVRSDLLEEQNVPVFCSISATKINPLIDVNAISSINFQGKYPDSVSAIGYHPARAALKTSRDTLLNSPILENIGYVVIVLKQNKNESSMPDFVDGNLTATLNYDIQNAFGIGQVTYYLPEMNDADWATNYEQYSFWQGRGYLRATGIDKNGATINVYSDKDHRLSSSDLSPGGSSQETFVPDLYCAASLQTRLDGLVNPDSRARLNINGDIVEVSQGESFLEGACSLSKVEKQGLLQRAEGVCRSDEGSEKFSLAISPKLKIKYNGVDKDYTVGDKIEGASLGSGRNVYVGYVGMTTKNEPYVVLVASPLGSSDAFRSSSPLYQRLPSYMKSVGNPGSTKLSNQGASWIQSGITSTIFVAKGDYILGVKCMGGDTATCNSAKENSGIRSFILEKLSDDPTAILDNTQFISFSQPGDVNLGSEDMSYYKKAIEDYKRIFTQFPNEKVEGDPKHVAGENALYKGIQLSKEMMQYKQMYELCNSFEGAYPESGYKKEINSLCADEYKMSNDKISSKSILVNGFSKQITLEGIYEPNVDEYGAFLTVTGSGSSSQTFTLTKNSVVLLDAGPEDAIFEYGVSGFQNKMYFQYINGVWIGVEDYSSFFSLSNLAGSGTAGIAGAIAFGGPAGIGIAIGGNILKQKLTQKGLPLGLANGLVDLQNGLNGADFKKGKDFLLIEGAKELPASPISIQLTDIKDENNVVISIGVNSLSSVAGAKTDSVQRPMVKGVTLNAGNYGFTVNDINLKKVAKVSVIPNIKKTATSANFSFHVGIEKRAIQLSPDQIKRRIKDLNETIKQWEGLSKNLEGVVEGFKGACLGIGATITIKNFFTNLGGESIARREVMTSTGGWNDICAEKVKKSEFVSVNNCLLSNNDAIEKDIALWTGVISSQAEITDKNIGDSLPGLFAGLPPQYKSGEYSNLQNLFTKSNYDSCASVKISQARDIQTLSSVWSNSGSNDELKSISDKNLKSILDNIQGSSKECEQQLATVSKFKGISVSDIDTNVNAKNFRELPYTGKTYGDIKNYLSHKILLENGKELEDKTPIQFKMVPDYGEVILVLKPSLSGKFTVMSRTTSTSPTTIVPKDVVSGVLPDKTLKYVPGSVSSNPSVDVSLSPNSIYVFDTDGNSLSGNQGLVNSLRGLVYKKVDTSTYMNPIYQPEASYFEVGQYKGMPAIVPFRVSEGWYVGVKQTVPAGGQVRAYDDSGAASSFYICNVGKNKKIEPSFIYPTSDDECQLFNRGVGIKTSSFFGLDEKSVDTLVKDASSVLQQAGQQYPAKNNKITIKTSGGTETINVGKPSTGTPDIQCQNFMSPKECWILFNACDPVICPPSRCDLGGTYHVSNVIQSGIIGSTLLCLPNSWNEKIAVPVCLTGIKAGMDGIISLFQNYRDCLQTNLDTGQTVGICDEIHSIYLCEMFYRQIIPFAEMGIPAILDVIMNGGQHGGGEYLSVQDAWNTADKSVEYIAQYYGAGSYAAFKTRATEEIGSAVCRASISANYPSGGDLFDTLLGSDSPDQYYGYFDEIPFTTATVPATSTYKVFYHIYAGKDKGAYYSVYLKSGEGGSYYKNNPTLGVASGYIAAEKYASETKEIIAPTGYKDLCISVNGQEQCGFKKATTDFAANYLEEMYVASEADDRDITTEKDCVSGTNSLYSLANLNVQEGVDNVINPEVYNHGLIRVCATDNPGKGTDANWNNPQDQRWKEVGYCDNKNLICWLDTESVKETLKSTDLINQSIGSITGEQLKKILEEGVESGEYIKVDSKFKSELEKKTPEEKIIFIDDSLIDKAFYNMWKAYLLQVRGDSYAELAVDAFQKYLESLSTTKKNGVSCNVDADCRDANAYCCLAGNSKCDDVGTCYCNSDSHDVDGDCVKDSEGDNGGLGEKLSMSCIEGGSGCSVENSVCYQSECYCQKGYNFNGNDKCVLSSSGGVSGSEVEVLCFYLNNGFTVEGAAYMTGNLKQESSLDPKQENDQGHRGIAQWDPKDRWPKFVKWATDKNLDPDSLDAQLKYTLNEKGKSENLVIAMKSNDVNDIQNALYAYEVWDTPGKRFVYGAEILDKVNSGDYPSSIDTCKEFTSNSLKKFLSGYSKGKSSAVSAGVFPVKPSDVESISWNFGEARSSGDRCHAGIDIKTQGNGEVVSIANDGTVVIILGPKWCSSCLQDNMAVIVDYGGYVVNYGEIDSSTIKVKKDQKVNAGDTIGYARDASKYDCSYGKCNPMLHFEIYTKGTTSNTRWNPSEKVGSGKNYCRDNLWDTKPDSLLDPTETLKSLIDKTVAGSVATKCEDCSLKQICDETKCNSLASASHLNCKFYGSDLGVFSKVAICVSVGDSFSDVFNFRSATIAQQFYYRFDFNRKVWTWSFDQINWFDASNRNRLTFFDGVYSSVKNIFSTQTNNGDIPFSASYEGENILKVLANVGGSDGGYQQGLNVLVDWTTLKASSSDCGLGKGSFCVTAIVGSTGCESTDFFGSKCSSSQTCCKPPSYTLATKMVTLQSSKKFGDIFTVRNSLGKTIYLRFVDANKNWYFSSTNVDSVGNEDYNWETISSQEIDTSSFGSLLNDLSITNDFYFGSRVIFDYGYKQFSGEGVSSGGGTTTQKTSVTNNLGIKNVLVIGDSITSADENYVDILNKKFEGSGITFTKMGFEGIGSSQLKQCVLTHEGGPYCHGTTAGDSKKRTFFTGEYNTVMILVGVNDFGEGSAGNPTETEKNLQDIYTYFKTKENKKVIALTITPYKECFENPECITNQRKVNDWIMQNKKDIDLTANVFTPLTIDPEGEAINSALFIAGSLHPNAQGYQLMADAISNAIANVPVQEKTNVHGDSSDVTSRFNQLKNTFEEEDARIIMSGDCSSIKNNVLMCKETSKYNQFGCEHYWGVDEKGYSGIFCIQKKSFPMDFFSSVEQGVIVGGDCSKCGNKGTKNEPNVDDCDYKECLSIGDYSNGKKVQCYFDSRYLSSSRCKKTDYFESNLYPPISLN